MNNATDDRDDAALERRARELFESSVEGLDGATRSRLNRSRQHALEAAATHGREARSPRWRSLAWVPVGALAASALVAVLIARTPKGPAPTAPLAAEAESNMQQAPIVMLAEAEDLELAAEADLDFYAWIEIETADDGVT
jgi:anti-sigma-K factor RskA